MTTTLLAQYLALKTADFDPTTKQKDLALWQTWKRTRSPQDLEALVKQVEPVLGREVNRWRNVAPEFLLRNEAKKLALKAFEDYDPAHGTALATHVTNHLLKLSRTAYARQSTLSVPEATRLSFNNFARQERHLEEQLGRPPSLEELSDHLRLPPHKVQSLRAEVGKREYMESGDGPAFVAHLDDPDLVALAWHDMTPIQRTIFEHRTGYNDKPVLKGQAIMKNTGLTQGQLSFQIGKIKSILDRAQALR